MKKKEREKESQREKTSLYSELRRRCEGILVEETIDVREEERDMGGLLSLHLKRKRRTLRCLLVRLILYTETLPRRDEQLIERDEG